MVSNQRKESVFDVSDDDDGGSAATGSDAEAGPDAPDAQQRDPVHAQEQVEREEVEVAQSSAPARDSEIQSARDGQQTQASETGAAALCHPGENDGAVSAGRVAGTEEKVEEGNHAQPEAVYLIAL